LAALRERLGEAAFAGGLTAASLVVPKSWLWPAVSAIAVGTLGAVLLFSSRSEPPPPQPAPLVAPQPVPTLLTESVPQAPPSEPAVITAPAPMASAPAAARRSSDRLAEEVALLSRATSALNAGRVAEALGALDEHQRKFPGGALTEERRGARAQALCALGRRSEAQAELERLARSSPGSPHLQQARTSCGAFEPAK
jgi:hypothetical protein